MHGIPKVCLVIEDNRAHGRALLRGISRYAMLHGPWNLYRDIYNPSYGHDAYLRKEVFRRFEKLSFDGLVTRNPEKTHKITEKGVPTIVAITEKDIPENIPLLYINHLQIGKMAAEFFIEKGYTQFAFCGYRNLYYSNLRANAFEEHVKKHGLDCAIYKPCSKRKLKALNLESDIDHIALWLKSLPYPTAILACNDNRAANIVEAAKIAQINMPEEVALLGIDNDELICNMCNPSLSSIQLNSEHGGYELAALLDDLMHGRSKMSGQTIAVDPVKVIERMSTDVMKVADSDVAAALNFIKANRKNPIQVSDVVEAACTSRSGLQKKFRRYLDRTIAEEITKSRVDYIKQLLLDTDYSISRITEIINMPSISILSRFFQKSVGMSPLQYRKKYQSSEQ